MLPECVEIDMFEQRTHDALKYGAEVGLPMLGWLALKTENAEIHSRMELPAARREISRIISGYTKSKFFVQYQQEVAIRQSASARSETALQVAERQINNPIAGYYSRAHPEIGAFFGEDWGADHTLTLRKTSAAFGHTITDPAAIFLEVIAPELIHHWIMEDLTVDGEVASAIQLRPEATNYGRLVLESECVKQQVPHNTKAHSAAEGLMNSLTGRRMRSRKRQPPKQR